MMPPAPIIRRDDLLKRAWFSNLTTQQIADAYGVKVRGLRQAARSMGLPPRAARRGNVTRFK